ncbi:MAG TPA: LacI family transcriptional regulator [Anaerolineae bacterium]|nr:LacI family transcriptional regulator [Anaerolineae bacterium]
MAVTIKDIAEIAQVSHTTVSRALRRHSAISRDTAVRIRQIADELGYIPNTVARGLKTSSSHVFGVTVCRIDDPFIGEVIDGIEETLQAEGYSLFLAASHYEPEREKAIIRTMNEHRVDGVIICSPQADVEQVQQLQKFGVPTVLVNNQAQEAATSSVSHDDEYGSYELTRHLLTLGHTDIGYLGNGIAGKINEDRLCGYRRALTDAGLPFREELVFAGPNGLAVGGGLAVEQYLRLGQRPSALVCFSDMMAIGALQVLQKNGLHVPQDCSIVGFGNISFSAYVTPPLTTFHQPQREIGREAALMALRLLRGGANDAEPETKLLRGELVVRDSTAPARGRALQANEGGD